MPAAAPRYIHWFRELALTDIPLVGGKNASLGEMFQQLTPLAERVRVLALSVGYQGGASYFIERLAEGVGTIAAAFYPRPVIVRLSDFKSNEYAALMGGRDFEPHEENPMIGFRGAARYIHPAYAEGFVLECAALK